MSKSQLAKQPDGTIIITIPLSTEDIKKAREKAIGEYVEHAEVAGFRKGKAPRNLVEEKLDPLKLQEEILKHLLPKAYSDTILEHKIKPIISPKIQITKIEDPSASSGQAGKDWEFVATTCEMPEVTLGNYKKAVKDVTAKSKIVIPGKDLPTGRQGSKEVSFDELMQPVLASAKVEIPAILVESEVERLLSQLLDEVKTLGLTLDQYLGSTHKTVEEVRKEYENRAKQDATIEFVLQKIADEENLTITPQEIEEAIAKASTPDEKANLEKNRYLLTAILRQQKTFDYLKNL